MKFARGGRAPRRLGARPRACGNGGFALVIVLWVLAGLTVVAVAVASTARVSAESTRLLRDRIRAEAAFISTAARIQVIASTSQPAINRFEGVRGRLYLDGRSTEVDAVERVSMQDARGLVNLNLAGRSFLSGLLQRCGVAANRTDPLVDALADYIDSDALKRLNGAEAFDYRLAGDLPAPRNAELVSRNEVWRVLGWPEIRAAWDENRCSEAVTVRGDGRFNQNTAPLPVLVAFGMDEPIAQGLLGARMDGLNAGIAPPSNPGSEVDVLASLRLSGATVGRTLRVRHAMALVEWVLEYELELTPTRPGGPWRLHEVRYLEASPSSMPGVSSSRFPAIDHRPSESEAIQGNAPPRLPFGN